MPRHLISLIIMVSLTGINAGAETAPLGEKLYRALFSNRETGRREETLRLARNFLKKYPLSRHVPDVRLLMADMETDWKKAVEKYRVVIDKYRYYKKKDIALLKVCEIHSLHSEWSRLKRASLEGIRLPESKRYRDEFRIFYILALINTDRLYKAEDECRRILKEGGEFGMLSRVMILLAYSNRITSGLSRNYIYNLRELIIGYRESYSHPAAVYLMGKFYESRKDYNRAYSAFMDIINKYPRSIESIYASSRVNKLKVHNPVMTNYIPGSNIISKTEKVDISPEIELNDGQDTSGKEKVYYTVAVGPMTSIGNLRLIKKDLSGFGEFRSVRMKNGYTLFVGTYRNVDEASRTRIRLAEEFGINGRIMRVSGSGGKKYIYGD